MTDATLDTVRVRLLQRGRRFAFPLPDALTAIVFAAAALMDFLSPEQLATLPPGVVQARNELVFALFVEGGFLMAQGTLIDIATRLKKRPPILVVPIILGAVVLFSGHSLDVLKAAWGRGMLVFIPLLISLAERGTVLWTMPGRSRIEKIGARAVVANRITTALGLFALLTAAMVAGVAFPQYNLFEGGWIFFAAGAIYFTVSAFDDWRVRGKRFAERPTVLFRFDPIHIDYLAPV